MHCFSHLFWDTSRRSQLQWDQQRRARDASAGKVEMSSCSGRWMCWQTGFQDPGDLAWEHTCVKVMVRGCSDLPCVAGSPHPESSKRHRALWKLSSEWVLFFRSLFLRWDLKNPHSKQPQPTQQIITFLPKPGLTHRASCCGHGQRSYLLPVISHLSLAERPCAIFLPRRESCGLPEDSPPLPGSDSFSFLLGDERMR